MTDPASNAPDPRDNAVDGALPGAGRRILILQCRGFGDAVIGTALIDNLRSGLPAARIDVLTRAQIRPIFDQHPGIQEIFVGCFPMGYRGDFNWKTFLNLVALIWKLRKNRYTDVINLIGDFREEILANLITSRNNWSPGFSPDHSCAKLAPRSRIRLANRRVVINATHRNVYDYLNILGGAVSGASLGLPALYDESGAQLASKSMPGVIGIHPATTHPSRTWEIEKWQEVADFLIKNGCRVIVFGAAAEKNKLEASFLPLDDKRVAVVAGKLTDFFSSLAGVELLLCHDSFSSHAAFALGVPIVLIGGSGDIRIWAPPGATVISSGEGMDCYPCNSRPTCIGSAHELGCIRRTQVEEVLFAVRRHLVSRLS